MDERVIKLLVKYDISYTDLIRQTEGINCLKFTYHDHNCTIFNSDKYLYSLKINKAYFIIGEEIEVLLNMLTKFFNGESVNATSKAINIRSIIMRHQQLF
jgi:hypothetical protein